MSGRLSLVFVCSPHFMSSRFHGEDRVAPFFCIVIYAVHPQRLSPFRLWESPHNLYAPSNLRYVLHSSGTTFAFSMHAFLFLYAMQLLHISDISLSCRGVCPCSVCTSPFSVYVCFCVSI